MRQPQIPGERVEDMLPGTHRKWPPHVQHGVMAPCAKRVGQQAIGRPVATAQHIAGARCRQCRGRIGQKGITVTGHHQFSGRLAGAVGIVTAQGVVLAVGAVPLPIAVHLVGGHHDDDAHTATVAHRVEQMRGPHDIRCQSLHRLGIRLAHQ